MKTCLQSKINRVAATPIGVDRWTSSFDSPIGEIKADWSDFRLAGLCLLGSTSRAHSNPYQASTSEPHTINVQQRLLAGQLNQFLENFFSGIHSVFPWQTLLDDGFTDFQKQTLRACMRLKFGQTCSYADLAHQVGRPGAARAVGTVMAKNRWPLLIPCHRVLGSNGNLGGYSAPGGLTTKRWLLEREATSV